MGLPGESGESDEQTELTPADLETIRLAASMGYYESPRRCRMEDIANQLGISKSAVYHRMNKVEREAISWFLDSLGVSELPPEESEEPPDIPEAAQQWLEKIAQEGAGFEAPTDEGDD